VKIAEVLDTRYLCLLPRIDPAGFTRAKMNIALRKRTLSSVRIVLKDCFKTQLHALSFMLFVLICLFAIGEYNLI